MYDNDEDVIPCDDDDRNHLSNAILPDDDASSHHSNPQHLMIHPSLWKQVIPQKNTQKVSPPCYSKQFIRCPLRSSQFDKFL
jgi:hypothetical protein